LATREEFNCYSNSKQQSKVRKVAAMEAAQLRQCSGGCIV